MEGEVVCPHKDLAGTTSMALSSGLGLLAGRRCYAVISLARPDTVLYKEARHSKWEVVSSEWSPTQENLLAVAANNKVELLRWTGAELVQDTSLRAHTRVVTDLAWHTFERNILATSAADTFIYLWDVRDLRRPRQGLKAVAGAAKIQWNKVSGKYLASAHEGEVKLWDMRNTSGPVHYINAHLSRIYDLDWSYDQEDCLATSSQDSTVQFWNVSPGSPSKAENMIKTPGSPVWKLQHTPVGSGLLTLVMQTVLRGQNNLMLWNRQNLRAPVHTFYGHTDTVLDFSWHNASHLGSCRHQLLTWSKDCLLRIWNLDTELKRKCGIEVEEEEEEVEIREEFIIHENEDGFFQLDKFEDDHVSEANESTDIIREEEEAVIVSPPASLHVKKEAFESSQRSESFIPETSRTNSGNKSMNLNYEFSLINVSEKLMVVAQDARERLFTVSAETTKNVLILHVKFPPNYPNQKAPIFSFLQGTTVDNPTRSNILGKLRTVAKQQISKNRRCLEPCLRQFEASIEQLLESEEEQLKLNNPGQLLTSKEIFDDRFDEKIPYPRSSGARFCGDGNLVCFGCPRQYSVPLNIGDQSEITRDIARTPRAMSAMTTAGVALIAGGSTSAKYSMVGVLGTTICSSPSQDSGFFPYQARVPRVRFSTTKSRFSVSSVGKEEGSSDRKQSTNSSVVNLKPVTGTVTIYSCFNLLPFSKELAQLYRLPVSTTRGLEKVCSHNAAMCQQVERPDLAHIWTILALSASGCDGGPGGGTPWASNPFGRQMLENMIDHFVKIKDVQTAAVLSAVFGNRCPAEFPVSVRKKHSKSETVQGSTKTSSLKKFSRAFSDREDVSGLQYRKMSSNSDDSSSSSTQMLEMCRMVSSDNNKLYDSHIKAYADLLYRWKMFQARTELLKCLSSSEDSHHFSAVISARCTECGQTVRGGRCVYCHTVSVRCSVCRLPCPGLTALCPLCGHGGHPGHLSLWFSSHDTCAAGCGCHCASD